MIEGKKHKRLARKVIYDKNPDWVSLFLDKVEYPGGKVFNEIHTLEFGREVVCALVLNKQNQFLMVKSYRYHTNDEGAHWEFPAGWIDSGEDPLAAGMREAGRRLC